MISVQSHRQLLSGNNILFFILQKKTKFKNPVKKFPKNLQVSMTWELSPAQLLTNSITLWPGY